MRIIHLFFYEEDNEDLTNKSIIGSNNLDIYINI